MSRLVGVALAELFLFVPSCDPHPQSTLPHPTPPLPRQPSGRTLLPGGADRRVHGGHQQNHQIYDLGKWQLFPESPRACSSCFSSRKWRLFGLERLWY